MDNMFEISYELIGALYRDPKEAHIILVDFGDDYGRKQFWLGKNKAILNSGAAFWGQSETIFTLDELLNGQRFWYCGQTAFEPETWFFKELISFMTSWALEYMVEEDRAQFEKLVEKCGITTVEEYEQLGFRQLWLEREHDKEDRWHEYKENYMAEAEGYIEPPCDPYE